MERKTFTIDSVRAVGEGTGIKPVLRLQLFGEEVTLVIPENARDLDLILIPPGQRTVMSSRNSYSDPKRFIAKVLVTHFIQISTLEKKRLRTFV